LTTKESIVSNSSLNIRFWCEHKK